MVYELHKTFTSGNYNYITGEDPGIFDWGVQIIGEYPKNIAFLNIPGI